MTTIDSNSTTGSPATRPLEPRAGSALNPMVEEITWATFELEGADHEKVGPGSVQLFAHQMSQLVEIIHVPGSAVAFSEIEVEPRHSDVPRMNARLAFAVMGPANTTATEIEVVHAATSWLSDNRGIHSASSCDPAQVLDRPDTDGWHNLLIRQQVISIDAGEETVEVISRFNPMLEPWTKMSRLLSDYGRHVRVRCTVMPTELSRFGQAEISRSISALDSLGPNVSRDVAFNAERGMATMVDLQASFSSPVLVVEIAVPSPDRIPDTLARGIALCFTSEVDVRHTTQGIIVAGQVHMLGGWEIERDVPNLAEAHQLGLPSRGGLGGRDLRDLITLAECPIGLPIPHGRPLPGLPADRSEVELMNRLAVNNPFETFGVTRSGTAITITDELRTRHLLIVGSWGTGKSTVIGHRVIAALHAVRSFLLLDPHGDLADYAVACAAQIGRPIHLIAPQDPNTQTFAPVDRLEVGDGNREVVERQTARLAEAIGTAWDNAEWHGPRGRSIAAALFEVMAAHGVSLREIVTVFNEGDPMIDMLHHRAISPLARSTLEPLVGRFSSRDAGEVRNWLSSKVHSLINGLTKNVLAVPGGSPTIGDLVADGRPIIVNMRGLADQERRMLGHVILDSVTDTIMRRTPAEREAFDILADEAHAFPTNGLRLAVTEGRKFGLGLVLASQSLAQLDGALGDVALAAGSVVVFRPSPDTAARTALHLGLDREDLGELRDLQAILSIHGEKPFPIDVPSYRALTELW